MLYPTEIKIENELRKVYCMVRNNKNNRIYYLIDSSWRFRASRPEEFMDKIDRHSVEASEFDFTYINGFDETSSMDSKIWLFPFEYEDQAHVQLIYGNSNEDFLYLLKEL